MTKKEFIKLIASIGFEYKNGYYYKEFRINLYYEHYTFYSFYNDCIFDNCVPYTNLEPIEKNFKRELRSIKLKRILE